MKVRQVEPDEWRRWREVRLRMLREDAANFGSRYEDAVREPDAWWKTWVAEADGTAKVLLAADEDEAWIGAVGGFVRVDPSEVHLISLWVAPEARGRGVAQALIRELAQWTLSRGAERILLFVQEANAPARALYRRLGFEQAGTPEPIGRGRTGFKLLLGASAQDLIAGSS
jgi:ribosomal protein S18 acetylase RimI-like enzyme